MNRWAQILFLLGAVLLSVDGSMAQIYLAPQLQAPNDVKIVRVSVKIITDAAGRRPTSGFYHTDDQIRGAIGDANQALSNWGADWRLEIVEILNATDLNEWFGAMHCDDKHIFENRAKSDPVQYRYRNDAINVYVFDALIGCGGYCSLPTLDEDIIIVNNRDGILNWGLGWLHEIGHYFGLLHTYQCPNLPCDSDPNICTGAGSERRDCPDVCPDGNNLMSGSEELTAVNVGISACQLQEMSRYMDPENGLRRFVVDYPEPAADAMVPSDLCVQHANPTSGANSAQSPATLTGIEVVTPRSNLPNTFIDDTISGSGSEAQGPRSDIDCAEFTDNEAPEVLRVDAVNGLGDARVTGLTIEFSEAIDILQVQNGNDLQIIFDERQVGGSIRWLDNNRKLLWTAAQRLPAGRYALLLAGQDGSDFQDEAGNILDTNLDGFFAVEFQIDESGGLMSDLPIASTCGTGMLIPGIVSLMLTRSARRRRR